MEVLCKLHLQTCMAIDMDLVLKEHVTLCSLAILKHMLAETEKAACCSLHDIPSVVEQGQESDSLHRANNLWSTACRPCSSLQYSQQATWVCNSASQHEWDGNSTLPRDQTEGLAPSSSWVLNELVTDITTAPSPKTPDGSADPQNGVSNVEAL